MHLSQELGPNQGLQCLSYTDKVRSCYGPGGTSRQGDAKIDFTMGLLEMLLSNCQPFNGAGWRSKTVKIELAWWLLLLVANIIMMIMIKLLNDPL
jgi:hypothetical protein